MLILSDAILRAVFIGEVNVSLYFFRNEELLPVIGSRWRACFMFVVPISPPFSRALQHDKGPSFIV